MFSKGTSPAIHNGCDNLLPPPPFPRSFALLIGTPYCPQCSSFRVPELQGRIKGEGAGDAHPSPCEGPWQVVFFKICRYVWYVFSTVHIILLPSQKPSSSCPLLKFVYVISQLRHSLVVHPLLRKILDPPLNCHFEKEVMCKPFSVNDLFASELKKSLLISMSSYIRISLTKRPEASRKMAYNI